MHQTKSYLRLAAVAGVLGAVTLSACVVTTSTDKNTGGAAGSSAAGAQSGGASSAGAAGAVTAGAPSGGAGGAATAGSGGANTSTKPACDSGSTPIGTPNPSCAPSVPDDCSMCIQMHCCAEYSQCYGTSPGNVCGYGGPKSEGEFACYQGCLQAVSAASQGVIDPSDKGMCANNCLTQKALMGAIDCGPVLGDSTNALIDCVASSKCEVACYGG